MELDWQKIWDILNQIEIRTEEEIAAGEGKAKYWELDPGACRAIRDMAYVEAEKQRITEYKK